MLLTRDAQYTGIKKNTAVLKVTVLYTVGLLKIPFAAFYVNHCM